MELRNKQRLCRGGVYAAGVVSLSLGITLSTKTGLGVSPITAVPYSISIPTGISLSLLIFATYSAMIVLQFIIKGKNRQWKDLMQLPLNVVFSMALEWFNRAVDLSFSHLWQNLLLIGASVVLTGVGIAMMVNMQLVPNPPDGLAQTMAAAMGRDMGFAKNVLDFICVAGAVTVDLLTAHRPVSVGLGTVLAMIFIGRVVALFNHFWKTSLARLAGLESPVSQRHEKHLDSEGKEL